MDAVSKEDSQELKESFVENGKFVDLFSSKLDNLNSDDNEVSTSRPDYSYKYYKIKRVLHQQHEKIKEIEVKLLNFQQENLLLKAQLSKRAAKEDAIFNSISIIRNDEDQNDFISSFEEEDDDIRNFFRTRSASWGNSQNFIENLVFKSHLIFNI
jgi:hypothetical protein